MAASTFPPGTIVICCENPYVVEGNKFPIYGEQDKENMTYTRRVDLPGLCKETLRVWADQQFLYIVGEDAKDDPEFDKEPPRRYAARVAMSQGLRYRTADLKYMVKDGVLKVMIPADN